MLGGWQDIDEDFLRGPQAKKPGEKEKSTGAKESRESAEAMLRAEFKETGKVMSSRIERVCERRGIDFKDMKRAAKELGVKIVGDAWVWKK